MKRKATATEHQEQAALFERVELEGRKYPELELLFAIPNGGLRDKRVAAKLKAEGVKPGVPDLCLPVARGRYHGLFIEMKAKGGTVTPEQVQWTSKLTLQGYFAMICVGQDDAWSVLTSYLEQ